MSDTAPHTVRDVEAADRPAWEPLWDGYLAFYEADLPPAHTDHLWDRILDEADPIRCIVAEVDGDVVGIAQYFPHPDTWEREPVCYLEDLFVDPAHRGAGLGRALIEELRHRCEQHGWRRLYWLTQDGNNAARVLYDRVTGGASGFIAYEIEVG